MSRHSDLPPNPREAQRRSVPLHWSFYPVTVTLIAICGVVALLSMVGRDESRITAIFFAEPITSAWEAKARNEAATQIGARGPDLSDEEEARIEEIVGERLRRDNFAGIARGEIWRLFTPMFIHFGEIHLLFNMMWLWDLGRVLESRFRKLRFLLLVLGTSLAANVAQAFFGGPNFGGMSGVIYGLFGFVLLRQKFHPAGDVRLNPQTVPWMLLWLVICFTGAVGPVANAAHVAGLISGGVIGWVNAMMGGGWGQMQRRRRFQQSLAGADAFLHRCTVCRRTERDDGNLDFRIGADGEEYCTDHLPGAAGRHHQVG